MGFGDPMVGPGQYLMIYGIIAVGIIAVVGYAVGIGLGGAILFFIGASLFVIIMYFVLRRLWNMFLHGSIRAGTDGDSGGGGTI